MRFGLSTHPALVLVLEGEVEHDVMMPRVMDLLDMPRSRSTIRLANMRGITNNPGLLASFVSAPLLGETRGNVQLLDRPLTRFIVAVDAEQQYMRPEDRERRRQEFVRQIMATVPEQRRSPALERLVDSLVHVESWNDQPFEVAHFTNAEIVDAIHRAHKKRCPGASAAPVTETRYRERPTTRRTPGLQFAQVLASRLNEG